MTTTLAPLTLADLRLCGSPEPFYLEPGENIDWIRDNHDGTATLRITTADGFSGVHDADIATVTA